MLNSKLIAVVCLLELLCGCLATRGVHRLDRRYTYIDKIHEAYLLDDNRLAVKADIRTNYAGSGNSKLEEDKIVFNFGGSRKVNLASQYHNYAGLGPETLREIGANEKFKINTIDTQRRDFSFVFDSSLTDDRKINILDTRQELTSLNKPFIHHSTIRGSVHPERYIFINKIGDNFDIIPLKLNDGSVQQPGWFPVKFLLYPVTLAFDLATFPLQFILCVSELSEPGYGSCLK